MESTETPDGQLVRYHVRGSGPPVMLCHGLLGDGRLWDGIAPALEHRYRLIVPDVRGHRHSPTSAPFSLWDVAADLLAVMDAQEVPAMPVIGFSMGGMSALRLALSAPERVSGLGLVSTAATPEPWGPRFRGLSMAAVVGLVGPARLFHPVIARLMFAPAFRKANPDVVRQAMDTYRGHSGSSLCHGIRAVFARDDIRQRLGEIEVPTQIIVGDQDAQTPPDWSRELAEGIGGSRAEILTGAGHMTPVERPDEVTRLLGQFLADLG